MPPVPNALGRQQAARQVIGRLQSIQEQHLYYQLLRAANDQAETDVIPGLDPKRVNGEFVYEDGQLVYPTYGESLAELEAAAARVLRVAEDLGVADLVAKLLEADRAATENGAVI